MKYIDIDNEEEILKECDFDYYYASEICSRELCMFFNDLCNKVFMYTQFDNKQAKIDLGIIGITLNKQHQKITDLEAKLAEKDKELYYQTAKCEKWHAHYVNSSELVKILTREHQYCLDNWRVCEQDKINYAVDKLKQLKLLLINSWRNNDCNLFWGDTEKIITQLITDIKEVK